MVQWSFHSPLKMAEQDTAPAASTAQHSSAQSEPPSPLLALTPPHVVSVFGVCLFGVVLIAGACVFGLCWLGGERARCRADGVPSAPYGPAVPSTLLSHRERRADRLLQGEHHFLSPLLSVSHTHMHTSFLPPPGFPFLSLSFCFNSFPIPTEIDFSQIYYYSFKYHCRLLHIRIYTLHLIFFLFR